MPGVVNRSIVSLSRWSRAAIDWLCAGREDYARFRRRARSRRYCRLRGLCKTIWIGTGLLALVNPWPQLTLVAVLLATLTCFALLDESEELGRRRR